MCQPCSQSQSAHLSQEAVNVHLLELAKAVDSVDALDVVGGIPRGVKHHHPVGTDEVDAQAAGSRRDEKQSAAETDVNNG